MEDLSNSNEKYVKTNIIHSVFPRWLKLLYSAFFFITLYVNVSHYGPSNFLWLCHFALVLLFFGMLFEKKIILSMMALTSIPFYISWAFLFFIDLFSEISFESVAYMFDSSLPILLRGISLFHIVLPFFIIYILSKIGYDSKAFYYQSIVGLIILLLTYLDSPKMNINWIHGIGTPQNIIHPLLYLVFLIFGLIFLVYFPTHLILKYFFSES